MDSKKSKFRFRLNLFDAAVIVLAALAALWLLFGWQRSSTASSVKETIRYTVRLQGTLPGTGALIQPGDELTDNMKNYPVGTVLSVEVRPATQISFHEEEMSYMPTEIPGYEDVILEMEAEAVIGDEDVQIGDGYVLRVGEMIYMRGPGYLGSGAVYAIERGVQG